MLRLILVPVLFAIACFFSGCYGAIHNQISYTVSPEYFTKFKFYQFGVNDEIPDRISAALVGWHATWWMGIVIGIILIPLGLVIRDVKLYFLSMIRVFCVVAATTFITGVAALAMTTVTVHSDTVGELTRYNNEIVDDAAFIRAGVMHNCGYLGGFLSLITGGIAIFWFRAKSRVIELTR